MVVVVAGNLAAALLVVVVAVAEQTVADLETRLPELHNKVLVVEALVMAFQAAWDLDQARGVLVEVVVLQQQGHPQIDSQLSMTL